MLDQIYRKGTDILLAPILPTQFKKYNSMLNPLGISFQITNYIDFLETNNLVAKTWMGAIPLFTYIHIFPPIIWISITNSILVLSVISSLQMSNKFTINHMTCEYICNYWILLFSKSMQRFLLKPKLRLLLGI